MLLTIIELQKRMLNCNPDAIIAVTFLTEDTVNLRWEWLGTCDQYHAHSLDFKIHSIRTNCRAFEREMHKAKRYMKRCTKEN